MPSVVERISVLETTVDNINDKISDVQSDVKHNHEEIKSQLKNIYDTSCAAHAELSKKINRIENFKDKWTYLVLGGIAVGSWMLGHFNILSNIIK